MKIKLNQFPTLEQVLRIFAKCETGKIYKEYRGPNQEMPYCHLTKNGFEAYKDLVAFLSSVATMSTGADGSSFDISVTDIINNINLIICYGES